MSIFEWLWIIRPTVATSEIIVISLSTNIKIIVVKLHFAP